MGALTGSPGSISEHNGSRHCSIQRHVYPGRSCTSGICIWGRHLPLRKDKVAQRMQITHKWRPRLPAVAAQFLLGIAGLVVTTFVCFWIDFGVARTGFAYVIVIGLLSTFGSFSASIVLSILAAALLNYFFAPPLFELRIDAADDIVRIAAFLTTSLVVTALTTKRKRAEVDLAESKGRLEAAQRIAHVGWW